MAEQSNVRIHNARIHFNEQGTPVASDFDDIYFSNEGGLAETDYVFLQQNGLPLRWHSHPAAAFHIIETGFGTGANFLLTWHYFRLFRQQQPQAVCQRLYFSTFEKFPLTKTDLAQALQAHPQLQQQCEQLLTAYPPAIPGCHRLTFDEGKVILDLWLGDVNELLPQLPYSKVDAIYLDGFAPGKNPDMWQPELFNQLASRCSSGSTLATFTAAGLVKRGLQDAGFRVSKIKGFGRKREMLVATCDAMTNATPATDEIIIAGGGIAALSAALCLIKRKIPVRLVCADPQVALRASHNHQGAIYPNLHASQTPDSLLHCQAFYFARQFYQYYHQLGLDFGMDWCGVLHLASNDNLQQRQQKILSQQLWPDSLMQAVNAQQASDIAGLPLPHGGIYFPDAGWLSPQAFCQSVLTFLLQHPGFNFHAECQVTEVQQQADGRWLLQTTKGEMIAKHVIWATGADLPALSQTATLPVNKVRGQVSHISQPAMAQLKTVLCHKGYITPAWHGLHAVGATFDRKAETAFTAASDDIENIELVNQQLLQPVWFAGAKAESAKAAFRATVPDHLPLFGQLAQGLYVFGTLGARGLLLAPLLAETLACQLSNEPSPLDMALLNRLSPQRFNSQ